MKVCFFVNAAYELINVVEFYQNDIKILKDLGFDVKISNNFFSIPIADIYFAWWVSSGAKAVIMSKLIRKPSIVVAGGADVCSIEEINHGFCARPFYHKLIIKWCLKNADTVITPSRYVLNEAIKLGAKNCRLVYNCVNTDKYKPKKVKKEDIILSVSHLSKQNVERKRHVDIIKSIPYVLEKFPDVKFIFIGKKSDGYNELKNLVDLLGIQKNVEFLGMVIEKEKLEYYHKSKMFVQPSLDEGFGVAIVEAMSCGLPVIVSNKGAIPEVVGDCGLYTPTNEPKILADQIIELLKNDRIRKILGNRARERVIKKFSYEKRKQALERIINGVLND